jgi:hypothetical protein
VEVADDLDDGIEFRAGAPGQVPKPEPITDPDLQPDDHVRLSRGRSEAHRFGRWAEDFDMAPFGHVEADQLDVGGQ